jgi:branched-chain amino acid aminotransferase
MEEFTYWVNGTFVPASRAVVPLNSRGYRLGDGVFDTERTFNGRIFRLDAHLARLERSLRFTRLSPGMSLEALGALAEETARRNLPHLERCGDFWVTQTVSRDGLDKAFVSIIVEPLPFARYAPFYGKGLPLVIPPVRTSAQLGMDPKLKATSRLNFVLADLEGKQMDPDALSVLLDEQGNLSEVIYGNLFVVRGGVIRTPTSRAILEGVSRQTTLELAQQEGLTVREEPLQPYDLYTADEAFVTTTSYCILPVASLNRQPIGDAVPGPVTRKLTAAWNRLVGLDIAEQMRRYAAAPAQAAPAAGIPVR